MEAELFWPIIKCLASFVVLGISIGMLIKSLR